MRPWLAPIGSALLALAIACAHESGPPEAFRVALLTPGSIADGGWNAGAWAGLEAIRERLGAEVRHVETRTPAEFEEGFRDFASRGFDLVFGHGFEYQEAAAKVGAEFPDTIFVNLDHGGRGGAQGANVIVVRDWAGIGALLDDGSGQKEKASPA